MINVIQATVIQIDAHAQTISKDWILIIEYIFQVLSVFFIQDQTGYIMIANATLIHVIRPSKLFYQKLQFKIKNK